MIGLPVKYSDFYGEVMPEEPLSLIRHLPKKEVVTTISMINSKLKPVSATYFDDSRKTQIECSVFLFLENNNPQKSPLLTTLMRKYTSLAINYNLSSAHNNLGLVFRNLFFIKISSKNHIYKITSHPEFCSFFILTKTFHRAFFF